MLLLVVRFLESTGFHRWVFSLFFFSLTILPKGFCSCVFFSTSVPPVFPGLHAPRARLIELFLTQVCPLPFSPSRLVFCSYELSYAGVVGFSASSSRQNSPHPLFPLLLRSEVSLFFIDGLYTGSPIYRSYDCLVTLLSHPFEKKLHPLSFEHSMLRWDTSFLDQILPPVCEGVSPPTI